MPRPAYCRGAHRSSGKQPVWVGSGRSRARSHHRVGPLRAVRSTEKGGGDPAKPGKKAAVAILQHVPLIPAHAGIQIFLSLAPGSPRARGMSGTDVDSIPVEYAL